LVEGRGHCLVTLPLDATRHVNEPDALDHARWLPWGQAADAAATLRAMAEPVDWLVVDHYAIDDRWERQMRTRSRRILAIDDIADRRHDVDLLLDHNPQDETGGRYDGLLPDGARRLIGPRYALLRPDFAAARTKRPDRNGSVRRFNLFMGGTDTAGATLKVLLALSEDGLGSIPLDVVIGGASPHLAAIRQSARGRGNTVVHVDASNVADLFARADLAIGAGGVAALERCCVGLPTITLSVASNQEPGLAQLAAAGAVQHLGRFDDIDPAKLAAAVRQCLESPQMLASMSQAARALVDGKGVDWLAVRLLNRDPALVVRPATMADAELLHAWRDAPAVRAVSLDLDPIDYTRHVEWLKSALADPERVILVGLVGQEPVGSLRYDIADGSATISIIVAPEAQDRGVATALLAAGERYLRSRQTAVRQLRAVIKPGNAASIRVFARAGFTPASEGPAQMIYLKPLA
jgi:UDP-2,4-diacetamido-2,4,6-trideoxy-beta-L-altropyranose hydrolase